MLYRISHKFNSIADICWIQRDYLCCSLEFFVVPTPYFYGKK